MPRSKSPIINRARHFYIEVKAGGEVYWAKVARKEATSLLLAAEGALDFRPVQNGHAVVIYVVEGKSDD